MRLGRDGAMIPDRPEGHRSLGYVGAGNYRCQCGELFQTPSEGALRVPDLGDATRTPAVRSLHDQWDAHCDQASSKTNPGRN